LRSEQLIQAQTIKQVMYQVSRMESKHTCK